jgi:hypothetical protein
LGSPKPIRCPGQKPFRTSLLRRPFARGCTHFFSDTCKSVLH